MRSPEHLDEAGISRNGYGQTVAGHQSDLIVCRPASSPRGWFMFGLMIRKARLRTLLLGASSLGILGDALGQEVNKSHSQVGITNSRDESMTYLEGKANLRIKEAPQILAALV
jgi:hypothetical protein